MPCDHDSCDECIESSFRYGYFHGWTLLNQQPVQTYLKYVSIYCKYCIILLSVSYNINNFKITHYVLLVQMKAEKVQTVMFSWLLRFQY